MRILTVWLATGFFLAAGVSAQASNKISSPSVEEGRFEIEYRGGYDFDADNAKDGSQLHKFVANYGITDRLRPEIKLFYANTPSDEAQVSALEASLRWQFWKPKEAWVSAAFETYYKPVFTSGSANSIEEKFLLEKEMGSFVHNAYISGVSEVGDNRDPGVTLTFAAKTRYKWNDMFQPGVEFYVDATALDDREKYQVGPVFSGKLTPDCKYELGYLFGASGAPDGRLKFIINYAWHF